MGGRPHPRREDNAYPREKTTPSVWAIMESPTFSPPRLSERKRARDHGGGEVTVVAEIYSLPCSSLRGLGEEGVRRSELMVQISNQEDDASNGG